MREDLILLLAERGYDVVGVDPRAPDGEDCFL